MSAVSVLKNTFFLHLFERQAEKYTIVQKNTLRKKRRVKNEFLFKQH